jgi:hypothetical protein
MFKKCQGVLSVETDGVIISGVACFQNM